MSGRLFALAVLAAATLALLLPISWYGSAALFLAVILPLGIFYPLPIWPQSNGRLRKRAASRKRWC